MLGEEYGEPGQCSTTACLGWHEHDGVRPFPPHLDDVGLNLKSLDSDMARMALDAYACTIGV